MNKTKSKPEKGRTIKSASIQDLLGSPKPVALKQEPNTCYTCDKPLIKERVAALKALGTPQHSWSCVTCAALVVSPKLGIFMGEVGTSELKLVDRVYQDSVREIFAEPDAEAEEV